MEFKDQEENEKEIGLPASYDSCPPKMSSSPVGVEEPPLVAAARKLSYRECLKNHAVGIAGHAVDGCGEFLPSGVEGTLDALRCAACSCHRSFHRKEPSGAATEVLNFPHHHHLLTHQQFSPTYYRTPSGYLHVAQHLRPLALPSTSGGGGGSHSRDEQEDMSNPSNMVGSGGSKKRHRTKFSQEQKDKMLGLAERLGWRIQKQDEAVVEQFCNENGLKRHVLKVWMHNNKHTLGKKP